MLLKIPKMCGATDICAAQRSLTLTLSPRGARELERTIPARPIPLTPFPEWKGGTEQKNHGVRSCPIPLTPFPAGKGEQKGSEGAGIAVNARALTRRSRTRVDLSRRER
jgi:hypothetical protein